MEFERKFKINSVFDLESFEDFTLVSNTYISQYHLVGSECDLRVRCQKTLKTNLTKFFLTLKSLDEGVFREEYNIEISAQEGKRLVNSNLVKSHIGKSRTSWRVSDHDISTIDIDTFSESSNVIDPETNERLVGLVEVEFPSWILAEKFVPYHWLGVEVTSDSRYRSVNLSSPKKQGILTDTDSFNKLTTDSSKDPQWLNEPGYWFIDNH